MNKGSSGALKILHGLNRPWLNRTITWYHHVRQLRVLGAEVNGTCSSFPADVPKIRELVNEVNSTASFTSCESGLLIIRVDIRPLKPVEQELAMTVAFGGKGAAK